MSSFVRVCPGCGKTHLPHISFCDVCFTDLNAEAIVAASQANLVGLAKPKDTYKMVLLDNHKRVPTGQEQNLPNQDGSYVMGRPDPVSKAQPDIDLSDWAIPYRDTNNKFHFGISRQQAVLTKLGPTYTLTPYSGAAVQIQRWPQGVEQQAETLLSGIPTVIEVGDWFAIGDINVPADKPKAPGLLFRIEASS